MSRASVVGAAAGLLLLLAAGWFLPGNLELTVAPVLGGEPLLDVHAELERVLGADMRK